MLIDCDTCTARDIACGDCVIGVLFTLPDEQVELDESERSAVDALAAVGLVPPLRLVASRPARRRRPGERDIA